MFQTTFLGLNEVGLCIFCVLFFWWDKQFHRNNLDLSTKQSRS